jgi:hypothetical protein
MDGIPTDGVESRGLHPNTEFCVMGNSIVLNDVVFRTVYFDAVSFIANSYSSAGVRTNVVASDEVIFNT